MAQQSSPPTHQLLSKHVQLNFIRSHSFDVNGIIKRNRLNQKHHCFISAAKLQRLFSALSNERKLCKQLWRDLAKCVERYSFFACLAELLHDDANRVNSFSKLKTRLNCCDSLKSHYNHAPD